MSSKMPCCMKDVHSLVDRFLDMHESMLDSKDNTEERTNKFVYIYTLGNPEYLYTMYAKGDELLTIVKKQSYIDDIVQTIEEAQQLLESDEEVITICTKKMIFMEISIENAHDMVRAKQGCVLRVHRDHVSRLLFI